MAWLILLLSIPLFGILLYLLFGENSLGNTRTHRAQKLAVYYQKLMHAQQLDDFIPDTVKQLKPAFRSLYNQATNQLGIPHSTDNSWELLDSAEKIFDSLIQDINASQITCHLEFYIIHSAGRVKDIFDALMRAHKLKRLYCRLFRPAPEKTLKLSMKY